MQHSIFFIYYRKKNNNNKDKKLTIITVIIICLLLIVSSGIYYEVIQFEDYSSLESVDISPDRGRFYLMRDLNIPKEISDLIDNYTLKLNVTITNMKISKEINYNIYNDNDLDRYFECGVKDGLIIENPKINFQYKVVLKYIINSEHQEIKNITLLGIDNCLKFSFEIDNFWNLKIKMAEGFENFIDIFEISDISATIRINDSHYIGIKLSIIL